MATTYRRPDRAVWSGQPWSTNVRQTSDYRRLQRNADTATHSQHILHSWGFRGRRKKDIWGCACMNETCFPDQKYEYSYVLEVLWHMRYFLFFSKNQLSNFPEIQCVLLLSSKGYLHLESIMLAAAWKKISAFCAMNNGTYETYSIFLFWTLKSGGVLLSETKKNQNSVKLRLPPECSVMITLMQCYNLNRCKIGDRKLSMKNNHLSLNVTPCVIIILMWYLTHKMLIYVFQNVSILHHRLKNIMRGDTI